MKIFKTCAIGLSLIGIFGQVTVGQSRAELILAGCNEPFDVKVSSGDTWFGLYATKQGYELAQTSVTVVDSQSDGESVCLEVNNAGEPIFLVRGIDSLTEGSVRTAFYGRADIAPTMPLRISLHEEYELNSINEVKDNGKRIHRVSLESGAVYQPILEVVNMDPENTPFLVWAGDLDRDGKLDLFFYLGNDSYHGEFVLYLSSAAEPGTLVGRVAGFPVQLD